MFIISSSSVMHQRNANKILNKWEIFDLLKSNLNSGWLMSSTVWNQWKTLGNIKNE